MCEGGRQPFPWRQPVHGARWRISRGCPTTASSPCWCGSSSAAPLSPSWSIKRLLLQSPACCVDRVTKETIARHLASNHPGHHRPSVDPDPGFSKHPDMLCGRTIPFDTIAIGCKKSTRRLFTSRATSPRACKDKEVKPWSQTRTQLGTCGERQRCRTRRGGPRPWWRSLPRACSRSSRASQRPPCNYRWSSPPWWNNNLTQFCFSSGLFHLVNVVTVNSCVKEFV